jgi:hypothetical protein
VPRNQLPRVVYALPLSADAVPIERSFKALFQALGFIRGLLEICHLVQIVYVVVKEIKTVLVTCYHHSLGIPTQSGGCDIARLLVSTLGQAVLGQATCIMLFGNRITRQPFVTQPSPWMKANQTVTSDVLAYVVEANYLSQLSSEPHHSLHNSS